MTDVRCSSQPDCGAPRGGFKKNVAAETRSAPAIEKRVGPSANQKTDKMATKWGLRDHIGRLSNAPQWVGLRRHRGRILGKGRDFQRRSPKQPKDPGEATSRIF